MKPAIELQLRRVRDRARIDQVFSEEVSPFLLFAVWDYDTDVAVGRLGRRICEVNETYIEIGLVDFPGRKRIPL